MNRGVVWVVGMVVVFYVLLALSAGVNEMLPVKKPPYAERTGTMPGRTAAACGLLVPFDTRADRVTAKGTRADCGIFPPSVARDGPMGPPEPAGENAPPASVAIEL